MDEQGTDVYRVELTFSDGQTLSELLTALLSERPDLPEDRSGTR